MANKKNNLESLVEEPEKLYAKDFTGLSQEEQYQRLIAMAKSSKKLCAKIVSIVTDSNGNKLALSPAYADWMDEEDDYLDLVAESYIEIRKIIEKTPKMSLGKAVYSAVWNSLRRMYRNEIKSVSALARAEESEEDEEKYTFDLESFEAPEHFSTEKTAEFSVLLEEICHDDRDMYIISMKLDGYTDAEIGESIGVSRQSIEKRFKNIKARYYSEYRKTDNELRRAIEFSDIQLCEIREKYIEFSEKWERKFTKDWTNITKFLSR